METNYISGKQRGWGGKENGLCDGKSPALNKTAIANKFLSGMEFQRRQTFPLSYSPKIPPNQPKLATFFRFSNFPKFSNFMGFLFFFLFLFIQTPWRRKSSPPAHPDTENYLHSQRVLGFLCVPNLCIWDYFFIPRTRFPSIPFLSSLSVKGDNTRASCSAQVWKRF